MENSTQQNTITFESFMASLQELKEYQKETDRILRENQLLFKETELQMKDTDRQMKETDRILKENQLLFKETELQMKDTDRRMKEIQKRVGSWDNNHGTFAEEYFFNSFENGEKNFFGENFDIISKRVTSYWKGLKDEYDIVLYNHASVAIIEVKYTAHVNDIPKVLKKAETFRVLFPQYKDFKIYLGLASMSFYQELEDECIKQGIAVIKQVGDNVVINDKHLKVF